MKLHSKVFAWLGAGVFILVALLLSDLLGAFAIARHYLSEDSQQGLSFSFKRCGRNDEVPADAVTSKEWRAGTLVITGVASQNCAATWLFGGYEISGDKLLLTYSAVQFGAMACKCSTEVQYEIEGLPARDYKASISQGPLIQYQPVTYGLFVE